MLAHFSACPASSDISRVWRDQQVGSAGMCLYICYEPRRSFVFSGNAAFVQSEGVRPMTTEYNITPPFTAGCWEPTIIGQTRRGCSSGSPGNLRGPHLHINSSDLRRMNATEMSCSICTFTAPKMLVRFSSPLSLGTYLEVGLRRLVIVMRLIVSDPINRR